MYKLNVEGSVGPHDYKNLLDRLCVEQGIRARFSAPDPYINIDSDTSIRDILNYIDDKDRELNERTYVLLNMCKYLMDALSESNGLRCKLEDNWNTQNAAVERDILDLIDTVEDLKIDRDFK